jgi:hypothetical protein
MRANGSELTPDLASETAPTPAEPASEAPAWTAPAPVAPSDSAAPPGPAPPPSTPAAPVPPDAAWHTDVPAVEALPIPDYDELSASQVVERLEGLDRESLDAIRRYETEHRGRNTILGKIAQLS